jgi:predicted nucleic acid-binding protein
VIFLDRPNEILFIPVKLPLGKHLTGQVGQAGSILRQDQDFSYTDAVSFVVMKQYGITEAFSFDKHFVTAGFTLIP